jgi:hypothetical protein
MRSRGARNRQRVENTESAIDLVVALVALYYDVANQAYRAQLADWLFQQSRNLVARRGRSERKWCYESA